MLRWLPSPVKEFFGSPAFSSPLFLWLAVFFVALATRTTLYHYVSWPIWQGEAQNVARSLALGKGFSDAFFAGSGPTAHLLPVVPLIASLVVKTCSQGEMCIVLSANLISSIVTVVIIFLLNAIYAKLGLARLPRFGAVLWLAIVPIFLFQESILFLFWDNGLSIMLGFACLNDILSFRERQGTARAFLSPLLLAVTFFVNPIIGVAAGAGYIVVSLRHFGFPETFRSGIVSLVFLCVLVAPWAYRNQQVMGAPIVLRDNFGLELSLANHDGAVAHPDDPAAFARRIYEIHPFMQGPGRAAYTAMGEVEYYASLSTSAKRWIADNPRAFAGLYLLHARQMVLPSEWTMWPTSMKIFTNFVWLSNLIGLAYLLAKAYVRPEWRVVVLYLAIIVALYSLVQPTARYYSAVYYLLLFCSAGGLFTTLNNVLRWHSRRQPA